MLRQQSPQNTIPPPATQDRGEAFDLEQLGRDSMSHEAFSLLEKKSYDSGLCFEIFVPFPIRV